MNNSMGYISKMLNKFKNIMNNTTNISTNACKAAGSYLSAAYILTKETMRYKSNRYTYNEYIKQLALMFSRENIFFIKFFQAVCTTSHPLLTDDILQYLNTFTDNAPYTSSEIDVESLERLIKEHSIQIKRPFVPIKSGTISLIFEGTLKSVQGEGQIEESVIIKCKRVGVDDKIKDAIFNMNHLISFTRFVPHIKNLNVNDIYNENKQSILDQLSFQKEVRNIEIYYSKWNKPGLDYIKIPKVYSEITRQNPNVIVMERIVGDTIYNICPEDKDRYAKLLAKFNFKSVFYDSMYHGDIHPGNIFFIKELKVKSNAHINDSGNSGDDDDDDDNSDNGSDDGNSDNNDFKKYNYKLGVIDFGIVGKFSRDMQNTIFQLFKGLYEKNHDAVAHCIIDNLVEPKDVLTNEKKDELIDIISKYSESHFGKDTHRFLDAEDIIKINKILYGFGVQFSKEFCKIELSFAISDSVCKLLTNKTTYVDQLLTIFSNYS
jgi:predicted unusual protein kinase regulating ubiquinone biosynthesis (AarF/ABC1/UbiB family)